ncbi:NHLM bacteriocin system ABC transporter, ATP-binding protein [Desulfosporosinus orientis DSM 765]|uniref:NHLM bacteriocin system ABC transporter, ATP-binding protein n=1 Tax=Desulfosporosinus orientis (strain ATCC 19365 / DSM 765 / NCIMB 8382 / VKM B-1628 / Singapore I) TaxID=768706 RepID=G7W9A5_DESOD|nr:NHLP bacteriocin export ABC transporter permease/ATPase subunit [Desulfosporosinus orientis]AET69242.1 NHLM bacteriocin system ABC transporter, ATP-binding protein [Desulfosporosinus orientis DSM 765]
MAIADFFEREGTKVLLAGSKPQILYDPGFVWLVGPEKVSVFITVLSMDNQPGVKNFLFEAEPGDLLFGLTTEEVPEKMALLASGRLGSSLIRLEAKRFEELQAEEISRERARLTVRWLENLRKAGGGKVNGQSREADLTDEALREIAASGDLGQRENDHSLALRAIKESWQEQKQAEVNRLQKKKDNDLRLMDNVLSRLSSLNSKEDERGIDEESGDPLLDSCRLVGQSMQIKIEPPILNSHDEDDGRESYVSELTLAAIARASRIRIREVALNGEWYKEDSGPILGFMEDDGRPVALIPVSPAAYILHDPVLHNEKKVDRETAAQIRGWGYVFFRPFSPKAIKLGDLLSFGLRSCWKRDLLAIVLMGILGGLLGTAVPLATGIVFDSIIPEGEKGALLQIALILGAAALAAMLFQLTRSLATMRLEGKMDGTLQAAVWNRLLSLPVPFFKHYSAGELAMRAMGISQIRVILSGTTLNTILSGIFSVFTFVLLFYYEGRLALVAAGLVTLAVLIMGYLGYRKVSWERQVLEVSNHISGLMLQLIGGVLKFRVAGAEKRAFSRWAREFSLQRKLVFRRESVANILTTFYTVLPVVSSIIIFYALTSLTEPLPAGQFVGFYSAFTTFMLSMVSLSEALIGVNLVIPLYQRAKPILETLPEDDENKINPRVLTGSIEVSHVSFRYRADGPLVLQDVSFEIKEGDYVALVGTSGCGKSTLFRIFLGFEKPETGKVYYNGQDLAKADVRGVRRQLGVVLQNGQLMTGNILSNIIGANPRLTIDDAWEAARMAGIEEDIREMPMGMFTMVSEGAGTISGGQKQRLMIARAIVNKPRIIFFDEATSALDNRTQAIVSQSLDKLQATRVVIAHRLSTIMNCNKILVMDQGKIVERGTFRELMNKDGVFADLARRQLA